MKAIASFTLLLSMLALAGCSSIARVAGATCEIRGVVRDRTDHSPVANLPVVVKSEHLTVKAILTLWPVSSYEPLKEVITDAQGRFSCVVPLYAGYRFSAGDMARTKWGDRIVDRKQISKDSEIEILVGPPLFSKKEPNQSPEPTSGLRPAVAHL